MGGRDTALEQPGKPIEIESTAERAERHGVWHAAAVAAADSVAIAAELPEQCAAVPRGVLRGGGNICQQDSQQECESRDERPRHSFRNRTLTGWFLLLHKEKRRP